MATTKKPQKTLVTVSIDAAILRDITKLAKLQNVSRSKLVENFIVKSLHEEQLTAKVMTNPVLSAAICSAFAKPGVISLMMQELGDELEPTQLELFHKVMDQFAKGVKG